MSHFAIFDKHIYHERAITLRAKSYQEAKALFKNIESLKHKYYFVGYVAYEFYKIVENPSFKSEASLVYFEGFAKRKRLKKCFFNTNLRYYPKLSHLDSKAYKKAFLCIKEAIAKGQSYQLNLTQELILHTELSGIELFKILRKEQNTKYTMYLKNEDMEILSFSPELFFESKKRKITTKPMKGTISKGKTKKEMHKRAKILQNDSKNRSENVMIVDLLRNDLAHIAKAKSIKVARLFEIESYKSLLQMTSTIKAKLRKNVGLLDIFAALFPCGSITGAPKKESMKLIESLEQRERGVYCGALGVVHKDKSLFSVSIRTLCKKSGEKAFRYGVGSGLVWDSKCADEQRELELKSAFLQNANVPKKDFYLFETMYMQGGLVLFFKEHLERLLASARHFDFKSEKIHEDFSHILELERNYNQDFDKDIVRLNEKLFSGQYGFFDEFVCEDKSQNTGQILRFVLHKEGSYSYQTLPLTEPKSDLLLLAKEAVCKDDLSFHKTSYNPLFAKYYKLWKNDKCFDVVFCNERGELCEGSRSNIIVQKDGLLYTPSLESGLLHGIYRQFLLGLGVIKEGRLSLKDLQEAEAVYAINSLRGLIKCDMRLDTKQEQ